MNESEEILAAMRGEYDCCSLCYRLSPPQFHMKWRTVNVREALCSECLVKVKRARKFITTSEAIAHIEDCLGISTATWRLLRNQPKELEELRTICAR